MSEPANHWKNKVVSWLRGAGLRPLGKSELARHLGVPPKERVHLRRALQELEREGMLEMGKGGRYAPAGARAGIARGVLEVGFRGQTSVRITSGGRAVAPDDNGIRRVNVAAGRGGVALPGDTVEVRLQRKAPDPSARYRGRAWEADDEMVWEARVLHVVEPGRRATSGMLRDSGRGSAVVEPDDARLPPTLIVESRASGVKARDGDLVLVEITKWERESSPPLCRILKVLGDPAAPGNDVLALMHRFDLAMDFPAGVTAEAQALPDIVLPGDITNREDWRGENVITIDPFDARDFDDAIHVRREGDGWRLAVHIADVAHYVRPGTALDREARRRGNSTYLVDRVVPMLPERLSNGICSLVPHQDRLTRVVVMDFDARGRRTAVRFGSAVIHSARRYTYEEAFDVLERTPRDGDPIEEMLHEAWRLAEKLRRARFAKGSLDLDFPEVKVVLDSRGRVAELRRIEYDRSHQLIEEFMLAANEAVATVVRRATVPCIYRVHDDPDADRLFEFREMARVFGLRAGDLTVRSELQNLLKRIKGHPEEHPLKLSLLKSLKRAVYAAEARGHFGLAKENYLHFTSPIRRYADLIAHRVLGKLPAHAPPLPCATPPQAEMDDTAAHISRTERQSAEAEMESRQMKIMEYFQAMLLRADRPALPAVITDARRSGLFIELDNWQVKGFVPRENLPPGEWWFEGEAMRWTRDRPKTRLAPGMALDVIITRVDAENRFLDFAIADAEGIAHPTTSRPTKKRPAAKHMSAQPAGKPSAKRQGKRAAKNPRQQPRDSGGSGTR